MSESPVGLMDPATRHAVVSIGGIAPGGSKVPAGTMAAAVIVVSGRARSPRLSHGTDAAAALGQERVTRPQRTRRAAHLPLSFMIASGGRLYAAGRHGLSPGRHSLRGALRAGLKVVQATELQHTDAAVVDAQKAGILEKLERPIDPLTRQADEAADLLLRERQNRTHARVQDRIEQRRDAARDPLVRAEKPIRLDRAD